MTYRGSIWRPNTVVWFRCPYQGLRRVVVVRQLKNGTVWIADDAVAGGKQRVHPSLLSEIKP